jgi:hypothetical protein
MKDIIEGATGHHGITTGTTHLMNDIIEGATGLQRITLLMSVTIVDVDIELLLEAFLLVISDILGEATHVVFHQGAQGVTHGVCPQDTLEVTLVASPHLLGRAQGGTSPAVPPPCQAKA